MKGADRRVPVWVVTHVKATPDYKLFVTFVTGEKKIFDIRPCLDWPIFAPLRDVEFFLKAYADGTTVAWNEDVDIAPEILYEEGVPA